MTDPIRRDLIVRAAMEELAVRSSPTPGAEIIAAVPRRLALTDWELGETPKGGVRYGVFLSFATTWLKVAGWVDKGKQGWLLTSAGRQAMATYDPATLVKEAMRLYRVQYTARQEQAGRRDTRWTVVREAVDAVPEGGWTADRDLADLTGLSAQSIGSFLSTSDDIDAAYRVLTVDGSVAPEFRWADGRTDDPRTLLQQEGVRLDSAGRAAQEQRYTADDLRDLLGLGTSAGGGARAWLVRGSAVSGVNVTPQWFGSGFVSLAGTHLPPLEGGGLDVVRSAVETGYSHLSYQARKAKVAELHAFLNRMRPGDAVVTTSEGRVRAGRVSGDPEHVDDSDGLTTVRRPVTWSTADVDFADLPDALKARLKSSSVVVDLTEIADVVEALVGDAPVAPAPAVAREAALPDLPDVVVDDLLVGADWLHEFVDLLRARRQVILYGPPGTGKTFLALSVAEALTDPANVRLVQFHPSYSYEDFFEGYRPTPPDTEGRIGFDLASGPLREIADDATANPGVPFVLVIDEINRANLAKVFGELYFLLEYRDRSIRLLYKREDDATPFSLPANLFIVGTMNTADRSIALVDTAMRRRFAFLSLHPDDEHLRGVLRAWLRRHDLPEEPADLLEELNRRIPDRELRVGPSYLMRKHEVGTQRGLDRIWRTAVLPLLEEMHYGDSGVDVGRRYGLDALRRAVARHSGPDGTGTR